MKKAAILCLALISGAFSLTGCESFKDALAMPNRTPVISSFDYNPKSGISKNDIITFSVVATDPEGKPLQYNWTASKGFLTSNAGSTVNWRPNNQNNVLEPGLSTVSVVVSDGIMTATASVNIYVNPEGVTSIESKVSTTTPGPVISATPVPVSTVNPVPAASASPAASSAPTAAATALPTAHPTVNPTPVPTAVPTALPSVTVSAGVVPVAAASPTTQPTVTQAVSPTPTAVPTAASAVTLQP